MGKKQIKDYKFVPGLIPPDANQYPNAVNLITANKEYIIEEIIGYLTFQSGGPLSAPVARPNAVAQLTNNKEFIKEEASAYITAQQATQSVLNLVPNAYALILSNKEFIKDDEAFCFTYGDGLTNLDLNKLIKFHKENKKIARANIENNL